MKKLLLCLILISVVLTACQNGDATDKPDNLPPPQESGGNNAEPQNYLDTLPANNFNGYTFTIIGRQTFFGTGDFVSGYEKIKEKAEKEIADLVDAYLSLG